MEIVFYIRSLLNGINFAAASLLHGRFDKMAKDFWTLKVTYLRTNVLFWNMLYNL